MFSTVHPKVSQGERIGLTTKFRCQFCRFAVDSEKRTLEKVENTTDGVIITVEDDQPSDVQALSGCPNCGSLNWSNKVPKAKVERPEDRPGQSGRWMMRRGYTRF